MSYKTNGYDLPLPPVVSIEDQRKRALEHYKKASNAVNHWSEFVEEAILAYRKNESNHKNIK